MGVVFLNQGKFLCGNPVRLYFQEKDSEMEICLHISRETLKNDICKETWQGKNLNCDTVVTGFSQPCREL